MVFSRVEDYQLASIERDYIKNVITVYDTEEQAISCCETLSMDNYEEKFFYERIVLNKCDLLKNKLLQLKNRE